MNFGDVMHSTQVALIHQARDVDGSLRSDAIFYTDALTIQGDVQAPANAVEFLARTARLYRPNLHVPTGGPDSGVTANKITFYVSEQMVVSGWLRGHARVELNITNSTGTGALLTFTDGPISLSTDTGSEIKSLNTGSNVVVNTNASVKLAGLIEALNAGSTVTINAGAAGNIEGGGTVKGNTVSLSAGTGIGDTTALNLVATNINASSTNGGVVLNNALATAVAVTFTTVSTTSGNINLKDTGGNLTVGGSVTAGGSKNITLTTPATGNISITSSGMVSAIGGTGVGGTVWITSATGTVTLNGSVSATGTATGGAIELKANGDIISSTSGKLVSLSTLGSGNGGEIFVWSTNGRIDLQGDVKADGGANGGNGGTITLLANGTITSEPIKAGNISSVGGGTVQLSATGGITQYGVTAITAQYLRLISTGGNVVLANSGNDTQVVATALSGASSLDYNDINGLILDTVPVAGTLNGSLMGPTSNVTVVGPNTIKLTTHGNMTSTTSGNVLIKQ